jgi:hypothetical protein
MINIWSLHFSDFLKSLEDEYHIGLEKPNWFQFHLVTLLIDQMMIYQQKDEPSQGKQSIHSIRTLRPQIVVFMQARLCLIGILLVVI